MSLIAEDWTALREEGVKNMSVIVSLIGEVMITS